jgi:Scramblase
VAPQKASDAILCFCQALQEKMSFSVVAQASSRHNRYCYVAAANYTKYRRVNINETGYQRAKKMYDRRVAFFRQKQHPTERVVGSAAAMTSLQPPDIVQAAKPMSDVESALTRLFQHETLVIQRQVEMLSIFFGYEQYNRYAISTVPTLLDHEGHLEQSELLGYLVEETSFMKSIGRQILGAHRPFHAILMDPYGRPLLEFHRPWTLVNSKLSVTLPDPKIIATSHPSLPPDAAHPTALLTGSSSLSSQVHQPTQKPFLPSAAMLGEHIPSVYREEPFYHKLAARLSQNPSEAPPLLGQVYQVWHLWRRQYDLVSGGFRLGMDEGKEPSLMRQFGKIESAFLAWDFSIQNLHGQPVALVSRHFTGFMRELFTDAGRYLVHFKSTLPCLPPTDPLNVTSPPPPQTPIPPLSLEEKATILGAAMLIDFDYFSRHSNGTGGPSFLPFYFPWGAGSTTDSTSPTTGTTSPSDTASSPGAPSMPQQADSLEDAAEMEDGSFWQAFFGGGGEEADDDDGW